jgi:CysZ protein
MAANFVRGWAYIWRAGGLLWRRPRLLRFVFIPFAINVAAFSLTVFLGLKAFARIVSYLPQGDAWYLMALYGVLWTLAVLMTMVLVFFTFTVIGNLVASPFNELLSERIELLLSGTGEEESFSWRGFWRDMMRAWLVEIKKMLVFVGGMLALLLLNLVPLVGSSVYALCSLLLTLFFLAWEYLGFVHERKRLDFAGQRRYLLDHKALLLGFSSGVMVLLAIPFLQLLCIPVAVTGATLLWCEEQAGRRLPG